MLKFLMTTVALFCVSLEAHASKTLTFDDVYVRIEPRLDTTFPQKPKADEPYYVASLKSDDNRIRKLISVFPNREGIVNQLRFEIQVCGTQEKPYAEDQLIDRFVSFVAEESDLVLQNQIRIARSEIETLKDRASFKQLKVREDQASVFQSLRLKRAIYKCDSHGGYGYSLDVFPRAAHPALTK